MQNKILVIFRNVPSDAGGAATVIRNLFMYADNDVTIAGRPSKYHIELPDVRYNILELPLSIKKQSIIIKLWLFIKAIFRCTKYVHANSITTILGVYRDESSLILSYFVSLISGKPLYLYLTDMYAENYNSVIKSYIQKVIFKSVCH
jgi:hypothetical protein